MTRRNLSTILFALSLISVGCTSDSDAKTPDLKPMDPAQSEAGRSWWGDDEEDEDQEDEEDDDESDGRSWWGGGGWWGGGDRDDADDEDGEDNDGEDGDEEPQDDDPEGLDPITPPSAGTDAGVTPVAPTTPGKFALPPSNAQLDYQLGGDYALPSGVQIVSRDRTGKAAPGAYNICYINGFQTQPGERSFWTSKHPDLLLRNANGSLVIDPEWPDELLLDISTPAKREALAKIEAGWIEECKSKGFQALEVDNLDSYTRSRAGLREEHAIAFMRLLSDRAHALGLAVSQKNSVELAPRKSQLGTDFAVAEQCNEYRQYKECEKYLSAYGDKVLMIEYKQSLFQSACELYPQVSMVLRDVELVVPGERGYVRKDCRAFAR